MKLVDDISHHSNAFLQLLQQFDILFYRTTNELTTWSKVLEQIAKIFPLIAKIFQPYMESEIPLPCLRDGMAGPCLETVEFNPQLPFLLL
jgi:hypothetical protein